MGIFDIYKGLEERDHNFIVEIPSRHYLKFERYF